jgi:hypothetical protein
MADSSQTGCARAFGIDYGNFLAYEISSRLKEEDDPWAILDRVIQDPSSLPQDLARRIGKTVQLKWKKLPAPRRNLLRLLSRFEITSDQAVRFYVEEERLKAGTECKDDEILSNPYLISELDRLAADPVSFYTVDRGLFPPRSVQEKHPLPEPSRVDESTDLRRVRALLVHLLDQAAEKGHTLLSRTQIIQSFRELIGLYYRAVSSQIRQV